MNIMNIRLILTGIGCLLLPLVGKAQSYTNYRTGSPNNVVATPQPGTCLMGGATEQDDAMRWFLERAGGGDVVVIRATGSDGYNDYLYTDLGVAVNSVETLILPSRAAANHPYVRMRVREAEAIWIAGGDQNTYVSEWKGTSLDSALNDHIAVKNAVIGGTSAGMAILCGRYFQATNGSITSSEALANPFDGAVTLGNQDFLHVPFLDYVVTDTHYDSRNRKGRHVVFLARLATDTGNRSFGIACDEYTAVCIDSSGKARVFGNYPAEDDNAYFLQTTCDTPFLPEICAPGSPLTWNLGGQAVRVYAVKGKTNGSNFLELSDWKTGNGGVWEHWWAVNGTLSISGGQAPACEASTGFTPESLRGVRLFPNPTTGWVNLDGLNNSQLSEATVFDLAGKELFVQVNNLTSVRGIDLSRLPQGIYLVQIAAGGKTGGYLVRKQ